MIVYNFQYKKYFNKRVLNKKNKSNKIWESEKQKNQRKKLNIQI